MRICRASSGVMGGECGGEKRELATAMQTASSLSFGASSGKVHVLALELSGRICSEMERGFQRTSRN